MGRNGTMEENKEKSRLCRNRAAHKDVGEGGGEERVRRDTGGQMEVNEEEEIVWRTDAERNTTPQEEEATWSQHKFITVGKKRCTT